MKLYKHKDKKSLTAWIFTYEKRREALRKQFGVEERKKAPEEYLKKVKKLNNGLEKYRKKMRDIDKRKNSIIAIANAISYFLGYNVKDSKGRDLPKYLIAQKLFCKYGMEHGIPGVLLSEYAGYKKGNWASETRMRFTKSFTEQSENKELYDRFLKYMNELPVDTID